MFRPLIALAAALSLSACAEITDPSGLSPETRALYASVQDGAITVPAVPDEYITEATARQEVNYAAPHAAGTIIVDPGAKRLYQLLGNGRAMRYVVGVARAGRGFSGNAVVSYQRDWPYWTPTANMVRRDPELYGPIKNGKPGGLDNPLGARALYLYRNGKDTLYRIHGTSEPKSIGMQASSGCIRMFNQDAMHLAANTPNGTRVIVLPQSQSGSWVDPADMPAPEPSEALTAGSNPLEDTSTL
ncbi:L,D-transpeptidase [Vannielia litorea]|uniref:L,D-transpeptidase n=1 Tax=Vannielia litorea TaxID=1217970 RepID=UPI001C95D697|nr:L,D-transpeptidase [Vannielia litorea]MBY6047725.1 L,D-transpeptidase [Vannielia litorea]MBY6075139.1 L,D-transpeptidase [Vannielia litorea]